MSLAQLVHYQNSLHSTNKPFINNKEHQNWHPASLFGIMAILLCLCHHYGSENIRIQMMDANKYLAQKVSVA